MPGAVGADLAANAKGFVWLVDDSRAKSRLSIRFLVPQIGSVRGAAGVSNPERAAKNHKTGESDADSPSVLPDGRFLSFESSAMPYNDSRVVYRVWTCTISGAKARKMKYAEGLGVWR